MIKVRERLAESPSEFKNISKTKIEEVAPEVVF